MPVGEFRELQTKLGWNRMPTRLLDIVDPARHLLFDWVHCYFVSGVFNTHTGLCLADLHRNYGITYPMLARYVDAWHWPYSIGRAHKHVLEGDRWRKMLEKDMFTCTASEGLSLLPVICQFLCKATATSEIARLRLHCRAYRQLNVCVQLIQRCSREDVNLPMLVEAQLEHARAYEQLFGRDAVQPKLHWSRHFPSFIQRWGTLPNGFCLERKHRLPKRFANQFKAANASYERTVLREVTTTQLASLGEAGRFGCDAALLDARVPPKRARDNIYRVYGQGALTAIKARINEWECVTKGDAVMYTEVMRNMCVHAAPRTKLLMPISNPR